MKPKIGILVNPSISHGEEHVLDSIGIMLRNNFKLEIVGGYDLPNRIEKKFKNYNYIIKFSTSRFSIINLFLYPQKFLNLLIYVIKEKPNILFHIGSTGPNGILIGITGRIFGIPTVIRSTGNTFEIYKHIKKKSLKLKTYIKNNILGYIAIKLSYKTIVLGHGIKNEIKKKIFLKINYLSFHNL
jgi:hypothetical protein